MPETNKTKPLDYPQTFSEKILNKYPAGSFWLTRIVFLRSLSFVYAVAFAVALNQNKHLLGDNGLLPVSNYMDQVEKTIGYGWSNFFRVPTLLWFVERTQVDFYLQTLSTLGLIISITIFITGAANMIAMTALWLFYHSIINIGQSWYSFGWESQLLETGFLGIFLCPLFTWKKLPPKTPTSKVAICGIRWLLFRIMFGAGMIKMRGDRCWADLTCMNYHYETQPVPNPLSYYLHQMSPSLHTFETLGNHFVELLVPWFTFLPQPFPKLCGVIQILFQAILIMSGNLSFLNWLTILPALAYFNDDNLAWLFSKSTQQHCLQLRQRQKDNTIRDPLSRILLNKALAIILIYLSIPVVVNLFSRNQIMNTSYDPFRIVNTHGNFGSITKERTEIILKGTTSVDINNAIWEEYEFKCKPGDTTRAPCLISPYHYRLDWLMWFAAFQDYRYNPWLLHLIGFLLQNDPEVSSLIAHNPFQDKAPPRFIKADHYLYTYTKLGSDAAKKGHWWKRKLIKSYLPPVMLDMLEPIYKQFGWKLK